MNRFSIKDIENLTGIKAHTIRIWEQRYGILRPKRTPTNIRFYDAEDLKSALRISLLNSFGYKISRIHQMTEEDMNGLINKISDADFKLQILTNELLQAALSMNSILFEQLLNNNIRKRGIEATIEGLVFKYLEKVGLMWMTNNLIPAQEHLSSHVIYRKLAFAIDQLPLEASGPGVLLFLPEGEIHDIGLMYVHYLLRKAGMQAVYVGANTPMQDVEAVYKVCKPHYLYTHLSSVAESLDGARYLKKLAESFPDARIMVSGGLLKKKKFQPAANMQFLYSLTEVRDAIAGL